MRRLETRVEEPVQQLAIAVEELAETFDCDLDVRLRQRRMRNQLRDSLALSLLLPLGVPASARDDEDLVWRLD